MFTVDDLLAIFQYLKDKSNFLELEDVFKILSESERAKAKDLFTNVLDQIVHSSEDYKRLRKFLIDWYSTHKTLTSLQSNISDVYALPEDALDELLLSLGYNFINRPLFTKQKFLLELITLYKGKGTANTIIKLLEFLGFTDVDLVEYWLAAIPGGYGDYDLVFKSETVSTDTSTATKWPDLQYEDVISGDSHWMLSKDEMKSLIDNNEISIPFKTPYFSYRPNYSQKILEGTLAILNRLIHIQYYEATSAQLIIDPTTKIGKFKIGETITSSQSGISTTILSSSYTRLAIPDSDAQSMNLGETITNSDGSSATIINIIRASDSFEDYVTRYRIIKSSTGIYLSLLELFMGTLYAFKKYVQEELNLTIRNGFSTIVPYGFTASDDMLGQPILLTDDSDTNLGYGTVRYIDHSENKIYFDESEGANFVAATYFQRLDLDYSPYGVKIPISSKERDKNLPIDIFNFYHGDIEIASSKDYDKIIEEYVVLTDRPRPKSDGTRANIVKAENYKKYIDYFTYNLDRHLFSNTDGFDEKDILLTFNPELKAYIDNVFVTGDPLDSLVNLFTELVNWIMSNVRFDFPNIGAIMVGGEYVFKDIENILNFFKPFRSRFIQGKVDLAYLFDNPLFESVIVEDFGGILEYFDIHDYLVMDSLPNYYQQNYTNGIPDSTEGWLTDPYEFLDTGSYFDIGVCDDKNRFDMFENYGTIEYLACQRQIIEQNRLKDFFTNSDNTLLQNHIPTEYGGEWVPFIGSSNLHIYNNKVIDKTDNDIPAIYYNKSSVGYNFRVIASIYGYDENGYGYLILRGRDFSGDQEYYGVKFRYYSGTSKSIQIWIVQKFSGQTEEIIYSHPDYIPISTSTFELRAELINRKFIIYVDGTKYFEYDMIQDTNITNYIYGVGYAGIGSSLNPGANYINQSVQINTVEIDVLDNPIYEESEFDSNGLLTYALQAHGWLDFDSNQILDCPWMNDIVRIYSIIDPPEITSTPIKFIQAGNTYTYDVEATDPQNKEIVYSLVNPPQDMFIDSTSGLITWVTSTSDIGRYKISILAESGPSSFTYQNYTMGVYDPNGPIFSDEFIFDNTENDITKHVTETGHSWYLIDPQNVNMNSGFITTSLNSTTLWIDKFNLNSQLKYEISFDLSNEKLFTCIIGSINKDTTWLTAKVRTDISTMDVILWHGGIPYITNNVSIGNTLDNANLQNLKFILDRSSAPQILEIYIDNTLITTLNYTDSNITNFTDVGIKLESVNTQLHRFSVTRL